MNIALLAGGTGGAMLAEGLQGVLPAGSLTVITNTGDDLELYGLAISPDTDSVLYRLAGIFNEEAHWGVAEETFAMLDMLKRYGEDPWFGLGDRDLATHLLRTSLLNSGLGPAAVTAELAHRLKIRARVIPMSEQPVRTQVTTPKGRLDLQEYFVRERHALPVSAVESVGAEAARPAPGVAEALAQADRVIIGPSNPAISIEPILAVIGDLVDPAKTMAITPIVAGAALKGPTVEMLQGLGREATPTGVARGYQRYAKTFVLDHRDAAEAAAIHALGYRVVLLDTVMGGPDGRLRLAEELVLLSS
ncbi:MAG TPA: 2-phospho-L-lactate transferase [Solirubrobacterales bacterium]|nr:2-phospho-L-lactate transferase [Solirubrobacterales bacterium]